MTTNGGHRVFIVDDEEVIPLSQKKFNALFFRKEPVLPEFAGRTVHLVIVLYTLRGRKPEAIYHVTSYRILIDKDGAPDKRFETRGAQLAAAHLSDDLGKALDRGTGSRRRNGRIVTRLCQVQYTGRS